MRASFQTKLISAPSGVRKSFHGGPKVSSHCDATNQYYGECPRQDLCRVVRGHAPEKICKITLKIRVIVHSGNKFWYNAFTSLLEE